jgi:hypothetical protein
MSNTNNTNNTNNTVNLNIHKFINQNEKGLIQVYIMERKKNNNELGVLLSIINNDENKDNKNNTMYLGLSNENITDELRTDIISKNNERNSRAFFLVSDVKNNCSLLIVRDLE